MKLDNERQTSDDITYVESKKKKEKDTDELICRAETDSQTLKTLWLLEGTDCGGGRGGLGFAIGISTLRYME